MKKIQHLIGAFCFVALASCMTSCDDDEKVASTLSPFGSAFSTPEGSGKIVLGVMLDAPAKSDVTVSLSVAAGTTAVEGEDFVLQESTVIKAGETNGSFEITLIDDAVVEEDTKIVVSISAPGLSTDASYTITVTDDDCTNDAIAGELVGDDGSVRGAAASGAIVVTYEEGVYKMTGLNAGFMEGYWGEEIQEGAAEVEFTVDEDGKITIPNQYLFTTLYDGDLYDYNVEGTGEIQVACTGELTLKYKVIQDGFDVANYLKNNNLLTEPFFTATLHKP